jgi:nuclear pore complex protein Nup205
VERANAEFVKSVITLSDLLEINEVKAASLLKHAIPLRSWYNRDTISVAIIEYNRERLYVLVCVENLLKGANDKNVPEESRRVLRYHLNELFAATSQSGIAITSYPRVIIRRLATVKAQISSLKDDNGKLTGSQLKTAGVSEDSIGLHVENLENLRSQLSDLFLLTSFYQRLLPDDIIYLCESQRSIDTNDPTWVIVALSLISAIQSLKSDSTIENMGELQINSLLKKLISIVWDRTSRWNIPPYQEVVGFQLGLLLKDVRNKRPTIEQELGLRETIESFMENNLHNSPFTFIQEHLLLQKPATFETSSSKLEHSNDITDYSLFILRRMIEDALKSTPRMIRNLKNRAEDVELPQGSRGVFSESPQTISTFEELLKLVSELYGYGDEAGLVFWTDPALLKFLKFMLDIKSSRLLCMFLEVLSSLATGARCAQYASEFLSTEHARLSWTALFRSLDLTAKSLLAQPDGEMHPNEVALQCAFLRLLRQVVTFSDVVRINLYGNPHLQATNTIFSLLNRRIPVELKAALFEVLASFTLPTEKGNSLEVALQIWRCLEQAEVLPKSSVNDYNHAGFSSRRAPGRSDGIRFDMDQIESQNQTYPETIAFLTLLNTLLQTLKPSSHLDFNDLVLSMDLSQSLNHYLEFVVDDVLLKAHNRMFASIDERWKMIDLCLRIVDTCTKSFEITFVSGVPQNVNPDGDQMSTDYAPASTNQELAKHYGFSLICRILSGSPLIKRIFDVLVNGVESLNRNGAQCQYFASAIRFSLRIILRVLALQKFIFDSIGLAHIGSKLTASMTGLDQILAFYKDVVVHIAMYINCSIDDEICLLAVNIITLLSNSAIFNSIDKVALQNGKVNRLVSLLSSSDDSRGIIRGFVYRLDLEESENELHLDLQQGYKNFVSALALDNIRPADYGFMNSRDLLRLPVVPGIANMIRLAILDLLISNVGTNKPFPTMAHYLLGYDIRKYLSEKSIEILDTSAMQKSSYGLHMILGLLRPENSKQSDNDDISKDTTVHEPLYLSHPKLSELCYQLLYQICADQSTSSPTMRFLRTAEDFFYRQLQAMPTDSLAGPVGTSIDQVANSAHLHQRAWLMKLIALELHITSITGQRSYAQRLLDLLYLYTDVDKSRFNGPPGEPGFDQPLTKMLEILNSLDFEKRIDGRQFALDVPTFQDLDTQNFILIDSYGHSMYDIRSIHLALIQQQKSLEKQGSFSSPADRGRIQLEIAGILNELLERNKAIEHLGARVHIIHSWCEVMKTTLAQSFALLPAESREDRLFEMLAAILPKINSPGAAINIVEHVSYVVLALLSRLREDRRYQDMLQTASSMVEPSQNLRLPTDSLQQVLLKGILESIVRPESTSVLRGNQYASLLHYLHYTNPDEAENLDRSVQIPLSSDLTDGRKSGYRTGLLVGNLSIINGYGDKLFEILCRDASDGVGVWKTVAFSLLEALCALSSHEKPSRILSFMVKRNFLHDFIRYINMREDQALILLLNTESGRTTAATEADTYS